MSTAVENLTLWAIENLTPSGGRRLSMALIYVSGGNVAEQHAKLNEKWLRCKGKYGQMRDFPAFNGDPHISLELVLEFTALLRPKRIIVIALGAGASSKFN